jgi:hypothetical protein
MKRDKMSFFVHVGNGFDSDSKIQRISGRCAKIELM